MPQKRRLDPRKAAAEMRKISSAEVLQRRMEASVQTATLRQYLSRIKTMDAFRIHFGSPQWDLNVFAAFLEAIAGAGYKDAEGWRSALWFGLTCRGEAADFLKSETALKMTQGVKLQAKLCQRPQGTITPAMFRDLLHWLRKRGASREATIAVVAFEAQLRINEVLKIRVGDAQRDEGGTATLFIRSDKRVNRLNIKQKTMEKPISDRLYSFIMKASALKKQGVALFQPSAASKLRSLIHLASTALKWPVDVDFRGPHALRHGGTRPLLERAFETFAGGCTQQSIGTFKTYARGN